MHTTGTKLGGLAAAAALATFAAVGWAGPSVLAAAGAPTVGPEVTVNAASAPIVSGSGPSVAFDGTNYLVVWVDSRNRTGDTPSATDIYGARVTPDGTVLDPHGIAVARTTARDEGHPEVAFDGTNFFVVWDVGNRSTRTTAIGGARVSSAGALLDPAPILVAEAPPPDPTTIDAGFVRSPAVAFNHHGIGLVTWRFDQQDDSGPTSIERAARVTAAGTVLDVTPLVLDPSKRADQDPTVVSDGTGFMVAFSSLPMDFFNDVFDVHWVTVSAAGRVGAAQSGPGGSGSDGTFCGFTAPSVGFDGTAYLIATETDTSLSGECQFGDDENNDITGLRVGLDGAPLGPAFVIAQGPAEQQQPHAVWDGRSFLVAYRRSDATTTGIRATRVAADGSIVGSPGFIVTPQGGGSLATAAGPTRRSGVVFQRQPGSILFQSVTAPK